MEVTDLLALLSRPGTLAILDYVRTGIRIDQKTLRILRITGKQYNARIDELTKIGVIKKVGDRYIQTKFGNLLWRDYLPQLKEVCIET